MKPKYLQFLNPLPLDPNPLFHLTQIQTLRNPQKSLKEQDKAQVKGLSPSSDLS